MASIANPQVVKPATKPSLDRQPKYYEADGALRAYANRSILIAVVMGVTALVAVAAFLVARLQPPTVIRVLSSGEASVVTPNGTFSSSVSPQARASVEASEAPTAFEKEAYARTFLDRYLNYDQYTIAGNWSNALNMMTGNLRTAALTQFQKDNTVGRYEDEHVRSVFKLSRMVVSDTDPLLYLADGVRTVTRFTGGSTEQQEELVESYQVRLAQTTRSSLNPTGLLVAQIAQSQINAESKQVTAVGINTDGGK